MLCLAPLASIFPSVKWGHLCGSSLTAACEARGSQVSICLPQPVATSPVSCSPVLLFHEGPGELEGQCPEREGVIWVQESNFLEIYLEKVIKITCQSASGVQLVLTLLPSSSRLLVLLTKDSSRSSSHGY